MSGFCPDDWHQTTEEDLRQMAAGEDYFFDFDPFFIRTMDRRYVAERKREYAIHDAAIEQAKSEGLAFHLLPLREQDERLDAAERQTFPPSGHGESKL